MLRIAALAFGVLVATQPLLGRAGAAELAYGRYHALVIGNNDYRNLPKLETAVGDAEALAKLLGDRYGFDVRLMRDATRADILRALNRYRAELTEDDNLLVFYAGHGWLDPATNTGFWQPIDAELDDDLNWISTEDLTRRFNAMSARHVMVIADSCYSGTLVRSANSELAVGAERQAWLARMAEKRSRTAIVSGGLEPVADSGQGGHSVFAGALLGALKENREIIEDQALFQAISRPVVVNADQTPQFSDIRKAGHEGGAFLFVASTARPVPEATPPARAAPVLRGDKEALFWESIKDSRFAADYEAYLEVYPEGTFARLARNRLGELQPAAAPPPPANAVIALMPVRRMYVAARRVLVRAAPHLQAAKVTTLPAGTELFVPARTPDLMWLEVDRDGSRLGFVYAPMMRERDAKPQ